jgi:hypothetical protein
MRPKENPMRPIVLILSLLGLAACTMSQENGNDLRFTSPPLLSGNSWVITQKEKTGGDGVCTVSAGEMQVTQRKAGKGASQQVAISTSLSPGDSYRVIIGPQLYEAYDGRFDAADSGKIIHGLLTADMVYTELHKRVVSWRAPEWRNFNNSISLAGFAAPYKACTAFIHSRK